jgi:hypothetical protein
LAPATATVLRQEIGKTKRARGHNILGEGVGDDVAKWRSGEVTMMRHSKTHIPQHLRFDVREKAVRHRWRSGEVECSLAGQPVLLSANFFAAREDYWVSADISALLKSWKVTSYAS